MVQHSAPDLSADGVLEASLVRHFTAGRSELYQPPTAIWASLLYLFVW